MTYKLNIKLIFESQSIQGTCKGIIMDTLFDITFPIVQMVLPSALAFIILVDDISTVASVGIGFDAVEQGDV